MKTEMVLWIGYCQFNNFLELKIQLVECRGYFYKLIPKKTQFLKKYFSIPVHTCQFLIAFY